jgi:hypothetical protein
LSVAARKFLIGLALLLGAGATIGWLYGHAGFGLMAAAAVALVWQVRQLLSFDRAMRTGDFDNFRLGEGIWEQIFSRLHYEHEKAAPTASCCERFKNQPMPCRMVRSF